MSNINKQAVQAVADLKAGYTLGHADVAILNELARIALASLEAEAVCVIDQSNLDYLKSGSDADVWPASRTEMGDVLLYRSAPPAPVSMKDHQIRELVNELRDIAVEYHGTQQLRERIARTVRAAMLQGADGALTNEDTKRVGELVMWVKRLAHSLRKANPDSKLQSDAMDYLSRKGLIGVEDILR